MNIIPGKLWKACRENLKWNKKLGVKSILKEVMMNIYAWLHLTLNLTLTYTQQKLDIWYYIWFEIFIVFFLSTVSLSQASKCIILPFFCKFGYQNETFRNYYLALMKHKNAWRQRFWTLKSGKSGFTLGRVTFGQKIHFSESWQILHNSKGNFNQNNINEKNFNQKLMFFDFIFILTLLLECIVTDLSGSEREKFLWWTATICTLKKNEHDTAFWWIHHSIVYSFKYTKNDSEDERKAQK